MTNNTEPLKVGEWDIDSILADNFGFDGEGELDMGRHDFRRLEEIIKRHQQPASVKDVQEIMKLVTDYAAAMDEYKQYERATDRARNITQGQLQERMALRDVTSRLRAAIERALNQRLAVKEGEAEFLSKRLSRVAKLAGVKVPEGFTHEQVVEAAGTILGQIATSLSTHPAPDDQQAKDAALLRDLLEDARDDVNECLNGMMHLAGYPSGDKKIARQREFLARIDAALSTTKQEEV